MSVQTTKEAVEYLQAMLSWNEFCKSHKNVERAISILLKQHQFDKDYIETLKFLGGKN